VIDASVMEEHMESLETIDKLDPTADTSAEASQDIAALLFAQLEFANVVLLNKVDLLGKSKRERARHGERLAAIVRRINPRAEVIRTQHARVPMSKILRTGHFTVEFAEGVDNWMEDVKSGVKHVPETLEYGVSGFFWTADRPFHPKRLYDWFVTYFALKQVVVADEDAEDDDEEVVEDEEEEEEEEEIGQLDERKACLEHYGNLFRSKGYIWIAGAERDKHLVSWQQAGSILSFEAAGLRDESDPPAQKLTFVGQNLKHDVLKADLEALLMTRAEIVRLAKAAKAGNNESLEDPFDPFPDPESANDEHEDHDEQCQLHHEREETRPKKKAARVRK